MLAELSLPNWTLRWAVAVTAPTIEWKLKNVTFILFPSLGDNRVNQPVMMQRYLLPTRWSIIRDRGVLRVVSGNVAKNSFFHKPKHSVNIDPKNSHQNADKSCLGSMDRNYHSYLPPTDRPWSKLITGNSARTGVFFVTYIQMVSHIATVMGSTGCKTNGAARSAWITCQALSSSTEPMRALWCKRIDGRMDRNVSLSANGQRTETCSWCDGKVSVGSRGSLPWPPFT